ncbi:2-(hydroxymethyl)glutarate dehydrogenase [bacterium HR26]|nr:2-(hydroxymethyl)glutarate dehydrogenase [bacterium HR26]
MSSKARVAVLGAGIMGSAVARNLLRAGLGVRVWSRTRSRAELLQRDGAQVAASPAEAAQGVDFLITLLPDASVIEEVVGKDVLASLASGGVWLQMSTVGIAGCERLRRIAAESGVAYVDAPVLGTRQPAEEGTLVVLASGPEELRERCRPIFEAIGSRTLWLGPAGMGSRLKLVTNNWIAGFLGALAETLALAEAIAVDPARFFEAIEGGPLDAPFARVKGRMMLERHFETSFSVRLALKDARLILEAAEAGGQRLKITEVVRSRYEEAIAMGHGEKDMSALFLAVAADRCRR